MIRSLVIGIMLLFISEIAFAQCIDKQKIQEGFQFSNNKNLRFAANMYATAYIFFANGETYDAGLSFLKNKIDIKQATANTSKFRYIADNAIKVYSGKMFISKIHFLSVSVQYPDPEMMTDSSLENSDLYKEDSVLRRLHEQYKKTRDDYIYRYTYEFKADVLSSYSFDLVIDKFGRIVHPFYFPSKHQYKPIEQFTYCRLINIARKKYKHIDPVESIQLSYNSSEGRFYWVITQDIADTHHAQWYNINIVKIDAANLSRVKFKRTRAVLVKGQAVS